MASHIQGVSVGKVSIPKTPNILLSNNCEPIHHQPLPTISLPQLSSNTHSPPTPPNTDPLLPRPSPAAPIPRRGGSLHPAAAAPALAPLRPHHLLLPPEQLPLLHLVVLQAVVDVDVRREHAIVV
ncbi:uncharacterized protein CLUP02_13771 [Colletotrichum lupini]|uniref:Uncharacterized protein n=1 Tax=Colletotrichum lupini TaxID=145971 RepID=A0A9Q8T3I9_9PEZI|nr:uncharacterized protein CLUP02_13771 [Colletotrichum lupini]UQC88248.1 hypothetical protein CLUP02_13771 [Colletotrichum lupini]